MSIPVRCGNCGQRYKVSDNAAGRNILCKKCLSTIPIPRADELPPPSVTSGEGGSSVTSPSSIGSSAPSRGGDSSVISLSGDSLVIADSGGSSVTSPSSIGSAAASRSGDSTVISPAGGSSVTSPSGVGPPAVPRAGGSSVTSRGPGSSGTSPGGRAPHPAPKQSAPPVAQPVSVSDSDAAVPIAHPVEAPLEEEAPVIEPRAARSPSAAESKLDEVRSDAMAEMLDEQERADRDRFRGLRRSLRNPPSLEEMVAFLSEHKLFTTVNVLAFFFLIEYLREREWVLALAFGVPGLGLSIAGLKARLAEGVLYQASAWCYLLVLCAFPILLANKDELGLAGARVLQNPTTIATAPSIAPALPTSAPPAPTSNPEPGDAATDAAPTIGIDGVPGEPENQTAPASSPDDGAAPNPPEGPPPETSVEPTLPDHQKSAPSLPEPRFREAEQATSETLRQQADRAFNEADTRAAFRYLHADAVAHDDSDVWRFMRWNRVLNRPAFGIRFGVGVDFNNLAIQTMKLTIGQHPGAMTIDAQKQLAVAFHQLTIPVGTKSSLGMLVSNQLCDGYDQGRFGDSELILAPKERGLRGATYLGADTPAELQRAARGQELDFLIVFSVRATASAAAQPKFSTAVRIVDVAGGVDLYPPPKQKPLALRKEVDAALEYQEKELRLSEIPESIDPAAIEARLKTATGKKPENPLALLTELRWYAREKKLPAAEIQKYTSALVGSTDASALIGGSNAEREKLVLKWISKHN